MITHVVAGENKMTLSDFKKAMCRGSGSCLQGLLASKNPGKYKKTVLWGCLHNISFDTQCEGTRAQYLFDLATTFKDPAYFWEPVREKFLHLPLAGGWNFLHFSELLGCFAREGNAEALDAIHQKYEMLRLDLLNRRAGVVRNQTCFNFEQLCISLVSIQGFSLFPKIAFDIGTLLMKNPSMGHWTYGWFYDVVEHSFGKKRIDSWMDKHSPKAPEFSVYVRSVKKCQEPREPRAERNRPDTAALMKASLEEKNPYRLADQFFFRRSAPDMEKRKFAEMAIEENDPETKAKMLSVFSLIGFPISCSPLIEYTKSNCEELQKVAFRVLGYSKSPEIHALALTLLQENNPFWYDAIHMLITNYKNGDRELLLSLLYQMPVEYADCCWHGIVLHILFPFDSRVRLPKETLRFVFEKSLCSTCRESAIRIMGKHHWLTDDIIEEGQFDSNLDIRKYLDRYYRNQRNASETSSKN